MECPQQHRELTFTVDSGANTIPLVPVEGYAPSFRYIDLLVNPTEPVSPLNDTGETISGSAPIRNIKNIVYLTTIGVGASDYTAVLDTGSADTWLVAEGFKCLTATGAATTAATCKFAKAFHKGPTFSEVKEQKFSTKYADGETLVGIIGKDTVNLGGIKVANQTIGIVNTANWRGDGMSSGLVGMAFPSVTRSMANKAGASGYNQYDPVVFSMYKAGLIKPVFSVALNREGEGPGSLTLGGLPPTHIKHTAVWATAPLEYLAIKSPVTANSHATAPVPAKKQFSLYAIKAQSFRVNDKEVSGPAGVIIDSGTTMSYLPQDIVQAMADAWTPAPVMDPMTQMYLIRCNSKPPKFDIVINGTALRIDPKDLILNNVSGGIGLCSMAIQGSKGPTGTGGVSVLGGPFMKSVVVVHDIGAAEMRFANRVR
jgi:hypothetical protein